MYEQIEQWGSAVYSWAESGQLFLVLLVSYLSMIALERVLYAFLRPKQFDNKDGLNSMAVSTITAIADAIIFGAFFVTMWIFVYENFRLFTMPNLWWAWGLIFLLHDFCYYVDHYISHRVGFFWAFHHVHHSSNELNITTASRGFLIGQLGQPAYLLMPLLGIDLIQFAIISSIKALWGIFNHTRLVNKMGVLEHILCTPSVHRVHHGSEPKYIDKNYGQVLLIWDKLFGTYQAEEEEPTYGLVTPLRTYNPLVSQFSGFRNLYNKVKRADRFSDKLKYLYKPPGWDHISQSERGAYARQMSEHGQS